MLFETTLIPGVTIIEEERYPDERGYFARVYCAGEFAEQGLELPMSQAAISHTARKATLRGLHYIPEEVGEAKLVRCVRGSIAQPRPTCASHQPGASKLSDAAAWRSAEMPPATRPTGAPRAPASS